jgi:hypothetical protein
MTWKQALVDILLKTVMWLLILHVAAQAWMIWGGR